LTLVRFFFYDKVYKHERKSFARVFEEKTTRIVILFSIKTKIVAFIRKIEDFVCKNCGELVKGDGYTNHCPKCLYSRHVDEDPGDRLEKCRGLMQPIGFDKKDGEYKIIHKCLKCGVERKCKVRETDDLNSIFLDLVK